VSGWLTVDERFIALLAKSLNPNLSFIDLY